MAFVFVDFRRKKSPFVAFSAISNLISSQEELFDGIFFKGKPLISSLLRTQVINQECMFEGQSGKQPPVVKPSLQSAFEVSEEMRRVRMLRLSKCYEDSALMYNKRHYVVTRLFLDCPDMYHLIGKARVRIHMRNGQIKASLLSRRGKPIPVSKYLNFGGPKMMRNFCDYLERYAVDDKLFWAFVRKKKHSRVFFQGDGESLFEDGAFDIDDVFEMPDTHEREEIYALGEGLAVFVGNFRHARHLKDHTGHWDVGVIARSLHSFFLVCGIRSVSSSIAKKIVPYIGRNQTWQLQADSDIDFIFFLLSIPFQSKRNGQFQNALNNYKRMGGTSDKKDVMKSAMSFFVWLWTVGITAFAERSFAPFFHSGTSWFRWIREAEAIKADFSHFEEGTIPFTDYIQRLDRCISDGRNVEEALQNRPHSAEFRLIHQKLMSLCAISQKEAIMERVQRERQPPFFISFYGNPGSGKTVMMKYVARIALEAAGDKYDTTRVHPFNSVDKYASGLRTFHNVILIDEISAVDPSISAETALSGHRLVMEVANSIPIATNQAGIEDKGTVFAHPKIVVITSNETDFGATAALKTPNAFLRRIGFRIHLHVKPQYRKPGGNQLDVHKLPPGFVLPHTFSVVKYIFEAEFLGPPVTEINTAKRVVDMSNEELNFGEEWVLQRVEPEVFFKWLQEQVSKHFSAGAAMLANMKIALEEKICTQCYRPDSSCLCKLVPQGGCFSSGRLSKTMHKIALKRLWKIGQSYLHLPTVAKRFRDKFLDNYMFYRVMPEFLIFAATVGVLSRSVPIVTKPSLMTGQSSKVQKYEQYLRKLDDGTPPNVWLPSETDEFQLTERNKAVRTVDFVTIIEKNMVLLQASSWAQGLFVNSQLLITVSHCCNDETVDLCIKETGGDRRIPAGQWKVISGKTAELAIISVTGFQKKDITHLIPLSVPCLGSLGPISTIALTPNHGGKCDTVEYTSQKVDFTDIILEGFTGVSNKPTRMGHCGSIYYTIVNNRYPAIVGMHVAGLTSENKVFLLPFSWQTISDLSVAISLLREPLELQLENNGLLQCDNLEYKSFAERGISAYSKNSHIRWAYENTDDIPNHVNLLGTINYSIGGKWRTRISPSDLQGRVPPSVKCPPKYEPIYIDGEKFTPARRAHSDLWGHLGSFNTVSCEKRKLAIALVSSRHARILSKYKKGYPLTEATSLNGLDGTRFLDKVKQKTGSGLPLRGPKTNFLLMGTPECLTYTPVGRRSAQYVADSLMAGINPGIVFDITFKDEVKKPEKAIRTFASCPAPYNELMRRAFLVIVKLLQDNYLLSGMTIGVDVKSAQWGKIYTKHVEFLHHVLWDFKFYDKSQWSELIEDVCEVFLRDAALVFEDDATVAGYPALMFLARGFAASARPVYAFKDSIFQLNGTIASGRFDTAHINSVTQEILITLCWIELMGYNTISTEFAAGIDSMYANSASDRLGDDGMFSTNHPQFNLQFISEYLATMGMVMTSPTKDGTIPASFEVEQWNYLKRGFYCDPNGSVWAPIEEESILKNINWKKYSAGLTNEQAHYEFVIAALQECASTGTDKYKALYEQIVRAFYEAFPGSEIARKFRSYAEEFAIQLQNVRVCKDSGGSLWKMAGISANSYSVTFRSRNIF